MLERSCPSRIFVKIDHIEQKQANWLNHDQTDYHRLTKKKITCGFHRRNKSSRQSDELPDELPEEFTNKQK